MEGRLLSVILCTPALSFDFCTPRIFSPFHRWRNRAGRQDGETAGAGPRDPTPHSKLLAPPSRGFGRSRRPRGWAHPPEPRLPRGPRSAEEVAATSGLREAEKGNAEVMTGEERGRRGGRRGGQLGGRWARDHGRTEPHARHPMAPLTRGSSERLRRKARGPRRSRIARGLREARAKGRLERFPPLAGGGPAPGSRRATCRALGARGGGSARERPGRAAWPRGGARRRWNARPPGDRPRKTRAPGRRRRRPASVAPAAAPARGRNPRARASPPTPGPRSRAGRRDRFGRRTPALLTVTREARADRKRVLQIPFRPKSGRWVWAERPRLSAPALQCTECRILDRRLRESEASNTCVPALL